MNTKGKVLVVDDNESVRAMLKSGLAAMGWEVVLSNSGLGVSDQVQQENIDVVLLDIVMEAKEGVETLLEIKEISSATPVVMISSHAEYLELSRSMGANATLMKPLNLSEVDEVMLLLLSEQEAS